MLVPPGEKERHAERPQPSELCVRLRGNRVDRNFTGRVAVGAWLGVILRVRLCVQSVWAGATVRMRVEICCVRTPVGTVGVGRGY